MFFYGSMAVPVLQRLADGFKKAYPEIKVEFTRMNGVYGKYFADMPPTRTTVAPLPPGERKRDAAGRSPKLEEISVIAVK